MGETLINLGPDDTGLRLSRRAYADARWQAPYRFERIAGRVTVVSPAHYPHRFISNFIRRKLDTYWEPHPDVVELVDSEGWVATSEDDDRLPDICVYLCASADGSVIPDRVPDLIVEVVSEDRRDQERDYIHKRAEYHRIGVRDYLIVDRFRRAALALTLREGDYAERKIALDGTYTTDLLPGLAIRMSEVFQTVSDSEP